MTDAEAQVPDGPVPDAPVLDEPAIAVVGVGLIGGAIAATLKAKGYAGWIIGIGRNLDRLEAARDAGLLDEVTTGSPGEASLVVYCTPVDRIVSQVLGHATHFASGALVTDGGSVKARIRDGVGPRLPHDVTFIGSHPLAGSEKTGWEHATADLYENRLCIVTPEDTTPAAEVERLERFWRFLGMRVVRMDAEVHDEVLGMASHVPHVVASALAASLAPSEGHCAASGFRDTTRIAAADPAIWVPILLANREAVLRGLDRVRHRIDRFHRALATESGLELERLLSLGKLMRDSLDD